MGISTTPTISRRQALWTLAGTTVTGSLILSGCGGSGGGDDGRSGTLASVKGSLSLPNGVSADGVQVTGAGNFGTIAKGRFAVDVQAAIPGLVTVWNPTTHKIVLMGILDAKGSTNRIDVGSTAAAILFLGLGGLSLNGGDRRALLGRIAGSGGLASLTSALNTAFAADPYALASPSPTLKNAIKDAVQSLGRAVPERASAKSQTREGREGGSALVQLEPTSEVDGFTFVQTSNPDGYAVQNVKRRYGQAFTYVTAHTDASYVETAENPPKLVGSPQEIPMTVGLLNTSGQGWAQVTSKPIALSLAGQDKKTKYEMIALAPVFGAQAPAIYSDPRFAGEVNRWKDEAGKLRQAVLVSGFMEILLEILGLGGSAIAYSTVQSALAGLLTSTQVIRQGMTAAYLGNVFYQAVIGELASSMSFEEIFLAEIPVLEELTLAIKGAVSANSVRNAFLRPRLLAARAALVAIIALGLVELTDIVAIARDTTGGSEANRWTGLVYRPTVEITPTSGTYAPGGAGLSISVTRGGVGPEGVTYQWSVSGSNLANLSDGHQAGTSFTSTNNTVTLATTPSTVGDLTVSVTVKKNGTTIGTAHATFKLSNALEVQYVTIPFGPRYLYPQGGGYQIAYVEVLLHPSLRTVVKCEATNNRSPYDGATASMFCKMPAKSNPIYPVAQEIVAAQNINLTRLVNEGSAYGLHWSDDTFTPDQAFRFVNYGDRWLVWLALSDWNPAAGPDSGLSTDPAESLRRVKDVVAAVPRKITILGTA